VSLCLSRVPHDPSVVLWLHQRRDLPHAMLRRRHCNNIRLLFTQRWQHIHRILAGIIQTPCDTESFFMSWPFENCWLATNGLVLLQLLTASFIVTAKLNLLCNVNSFCLFVYVLKLVLSLRWVYFSTVSAQRQLRHNWALIKVALVHRVPLLIKERAISVSMLRVLCGEVIDGWLHETLLL
jgi:hypothetical protein